MMLARPPLRSGTTIEPLMFNHRLENHGRTRGFLISSRAAGGWDVLEEMDRRVVREVHYDDWHRVERAVATLELEVRALTAKGWRVEAAPMSR